MSQIEMFPKDEGTKREAWGNSPLERLIVESNMYGKVEVTPQGCAACTSKSCRHAKVFDDVKSYGGHESSDLQYVLKSAMHKEIRRGDVARALRWARWGEHYHGEDWPKTYVRGVLFEETYNIELLKRWKRLSRRGYAAFVSEIAASKKKWELPSRKGAFVSTVEAFARTFDLAPFATREELDADLKKAHTFEEVLNVFWGAMRSPSRKEAARWLVEGLRERATSPEARELAEGLWSVHPYFGPLMLIEMIYGKGSPEANLVNPIPEKDLLAEEVPTVPLYPMYAHDCHTSTGKARLRRNWGGIGPGVSAPATVDLRWSGMVIGVLWRELAFEQFGDSYKEAEWQDVKIPGEIWKAALKEDEYFYPGFFQSLDR